MGNAKLRLAMLISGSGSTMQAILRSININRLTGIDPVTVIASTPDAKGLDRAEAEVIPTLTTHIVNPDECNSSEEFGEKILNICKKRHVDIIGQYGWMPLTPNNVIAVYADRCINQHPGPVPEFGGKGMYGRRVHCARLLFCRMTGRSFMTYAISQRVAVKFDEGAILNIGAIPIMNNDTVESLQQRVLPVEHRVQIETLQAFADDTVQEYSLAPLVSEDEQPILKRAKKIARLLYPHG